MRNLPETAAEIVEQSSGQIKKAGFTVTGTVRRTVNGPRFPVVRLYNVWDTFAEFDNQTDANQFLEKHKALLPDDSRVMVWQSLV